MSSKKENNKLKAAAIAAALNKIDSSLGKGKKRYGHKVKVKGLVIFKAYYSGRILEEGDEVIYRGHTDLKGNLPKWLHPLDKVEIIEPSKHIKAKTVKAASDAVNVDSNEDEGVFDPSAEEEKESEEVQDFIGQ